MFEQSLLLEELVRVKREELLKEAEQARLAAQARVGKTPLRRNTPLVGRALAWLGWRMVTWGVRLQDRYRPAEAPLFRVE